MQNIRHNASMKHSIALAGHQENMGKRQCREVDSTSHT